MTEQGKKDFIMEQDNMGQDNRKQQLRESSEGLQKTDAVSQNLFRMLPVLFPEPDCRKRRGTVADKRLFLHLASV